MNERNASAALFGKHFNTPSCMTSGVHPQLGIADVSGLFMILTFGIAYCIFSLVVENSLSFLVYWRRHLASKWDLPRDN